MATRRSALGRGLGALIPSAGTPASAASNAATARGSKQSPVDSVDDRPGGVAQIEVDRIEPNPDQPRRLFAEDQLALLTESIRLHGVLQPVVVRRAPQAGRYELIVGERRWRASRAAGLRTVPAVVADTESADLLEVAIVENVQRHDLNPMELASAFRTLADRGATQDEISEKLSLGRSSVANHLRLLELSRDMQEDLELGRLSMGHAKALLQIANPERRRHLRDQIVNEGFSVREAERRARASATPSKASASKKASADGQTSHAELSEMLQRHLQARVRIRGTSSGRVEIDYSGSEDLQRIASLLLEGVDV